MPRGCVGGNRPVRAPALAARLQCRGWLIYEAMMASMASHDAVGVSRRSRVAQRRALPRAMSAAQVLSRAVSTCRGYRLAILGDSAGDGARLLTSFSMPPQTISAY